MRAGTMRQKAIAKSLTLLLPAVPYSDSSRSVLQRSAPI